MNSDKPKKNLEVDYTKEFEIIQKELLNQKTHIMGINENIDSMLKSIGRIINEETNLKINENKKYCPICKTSNLFLPFGVNPRENAKCPNCESFERHRFFYLFVEKMKLFEGKKKILHFAPEKTISNILQNNENIDYWPVDIDPRKKIREVVDIQDIPYENNSFDIIINIHVLEHIPDELKAMKELLRVVKPKSKGGCVLIMVPVFNIEKTIEKEEYNTPELRLKYYGQVDHVRKYGLDFEKRLKEAGFTVEKTKPIDLISAEEIIRYGIRDENVYLCTK